MFQELKLTTTFLVATPSVLWRHQVAGPTSPAWVRAPAALQLTRRGRKKNPMEDGRLWELCGAHDENSGPGGSRPRPSSLHRSPHPPPPLSEDPPPKLWTTEDSVRNITRKKSSASYDEKEKKKIQPLLIWALLTALLCFYTIHSLCHVFFQC